MTCEGSLAMFWAAFTQRDYWLIQNLNDRSLILNVTYRLVMMALFFYLMILAGCLCACTDFNRPLLWTCEQFEWHWELL
jgi:hypothetical protein